MKKTLICFLVIVLAVWVAEYVQAFVYISTKVFDPLKPMSESTSIFILELSPFIRHSITAILVMIFIWVAKKGMQFFENQKASK